MRSAHVRCGVPGKHLRISDTARDGVACINLRTASRQLRPAETWDFGHGFAASAASAHPQTQVATPTRAIYGRTSVSRFDGLPRAACPWCNVWVGGPIDTASGRGGYPRKECLLVRVPQCTQCAPSSPRSRVSNQARTKGWCGIWAKIMYQDLGSPSAPPPTCRRSRPILSCVPDAAHRRASQAGARWKRTSVKHCLEAFREL